MTPRAAAEVLSGGDPTVVDPGASLLIRATRRLSRFSSDCASRCTGPDWSAGPAAALAWRAAVAARYRRIMGEAQRQQVAARRSGRRLWLIISVFPP